MERDGTVVETIVAGLRKPGAEPGTEMVRAVLRVCDPDGRECEIITDDEMRAYSLVSLTELVCAEGAFERCAAYSYFDLGADEVLTNDDPQGNTVVVFRRK